MTFREVITDKCFILKTLIWHSGRKLLAYATKLALEIRQFETKARKKSKAISFCFCVVVDQRGDGRSVNELGPHLTVLQRSMCQHLMADVHLMLI